MAYPTWLFLATGMIYDQLWNSWDLDLISGTLLVLGVESLADGHTSGDQVRVTAQQRGSFSGTKNAKSLLSSKLEDWKFFLDWSVLWHALAQTAIDDLGICQNTNRCTTWRTRVTRVYYTSTDSPEKQQQSLSYTLLSKTRQSMLIERQRPSSLSHV